MGHRGRGRISTGLGILLALVLSGCSSSPSPPPAPSALSTVSTCAVLSPAQVARVVGHSVKLQHQLRDCFYVVGKGTYVDIEAVDSSAARSSLEALWKFAKPGDGMDWNRTTVDQTPVLWIAYPDVVGGGGRLSAAYGGYALTVAVTKGISRTAESTAVTLMSALFNRVNGGGGA